MITALLNPIPGLIGLGVFAALIWWAQQMHTFRWRLLERAFAGEDKGPTETRALANLIIRGGDADGAWANAFWSNYSGITSVTVSPRGLGLKLIWPFGIGCQPLFIPVSDWQVSRTNWYLNAVSYSLSTPQLPHLELILSDDLMDWINAASNQPAGMMQAPVVS